MDDKIDYDAYVYLRVALKPVFHKQQRKPDYEIIDFWLSPNSYGAGDTIETHAIPAYIAKTIARNLGYSTQSEQFLQLCQEKNIVPRDKPHYVNRACAVTRAPQSWHYQEVINAFVQPVNKLNVIHAMEVNAWFPLNDYSKLYELDFTDKFTRYILAHNYQLPTRELFGYKPVLRYNSPKVVQNIIANIIIQNQFAWKNAAWVVSPQIVFQPH